MSFTPDLSKSNYIKTFGYSMSPLLKDGDIIFYKKILFSKLQLDDIVLFNTENIYKTHRIIYKNTNYIVTKGDNNFVNDGKIYESQIIGKVYKVKRGKYVFSPQDLYQTQSLFYFNEINKIKKLLQKAGINFVFLKGLPLHLYYTRNNPKRLYHDCDILIQSQDFSKAQAILERSDYFQIETSNNSPSEIHPEYSFYKKLHGFIVVFDIHTEPVFLLTRISGLNNLYPKSLLHAMTKIFLKNHRKVSVNNISYNILSPIFLVVYLSLHFFHHNYRGAYRLSLLDFIINKEISNKNKKEISHFWEEIVVFCLKYKLENFVYPCFFFLKKYYKTPIPNTYMTDLKPKKMYLIFIEKYILGIDLFNEQSQTKAGIDRFSYIFFLSKESLFKKCGVFLQYKVWVLIKEVCVNKVYFLLGKRFNTE